MAKTTLSTPSVLAFESKLTCSDALMRAGKWNNRNNDTDWQPILITEKAIRGSIITRQKTTITNDPTKLNAEIQKANLQTVDNAALPFDCDTLQVCFTLRVVGGLNTPSTCNCPEYQERLSELVDSYIEKNDLSELASRYALNLANGRFLWRNRVGVENVEVQVSSGNTSWTFDSLNLGLRNFDQKEKVLNLSQTIKKGLKNEEAVLLTVKAFSQLGEGQAVFPSQELVLDKTEKKSKILYQVNNIAAIHSQKIGNALRTIDSWHPEAKEVGPIAIEPYGSVTNRGKTYRQPKTKQDFYSLLDSWILKEKEPTTEQQHYIMAMLIRGGVFGE